VTAFSPSGSPLWSTYLDGKSEDIANGIAIDPAGNLYVAG